MKERWFNYRPICLICAFLLLGSIFAFYISAYKVFLIILASAIFISLLALAIYKKKLKYFGVPLTAFIIGIFSYNLAIINFNKTIEYKPDHIEARISAIGKIYDNKYIKVQADNCIFDNEEVEDNIYVIIYGNEEQLSSLEIGRTISFESKNFKENDIFYYGTQDSKDFANNVKYTVITQFKNIEFGEVNKTFDENFREKIKENLNLSLTIDNAELAYSALFGDKTILDDEFQDAFRLSGVAHLLAVSGLHVGIIVTALSFILKPLKYKKWLRFSIVTTILMFYMYICGFAMSVMRAVIMSIILLLSKNLNEEYDIYNSISIAGIVIFLINPLCMFDPSFLMSFSCVFGIAMLYKPIYTALRKIKIHNIIAPSIAISLSTTISLMIIMAFYFESLSIISILANVILIPLFTIAFVPIFIIIMLSMIIPYAAYVLFPVNYLLNFIVLIANIFANTPLSNVTTIGINYIAIIAYFVLLVLIGKLCSAKIKYKFVISLPTLALLLYCLL